MAVVSSLLFVRPVIDALHFKAAIVSGLIQRGIARLAPCRIERLACGNQFAIRVSRLRNGSRAAHWTQALALLVFRPGWEHLIGHGSYLLVD
jgi:hypothetical protein